MPVDEFQLRTLARKLAGLYRQLHQLKYTPAQQPEAKTSIQPAGSKTPGNWLYMSIYIDQEQKLREVAFNAFADIGVKLKDSDAGAVRLCERISYHAQAISELEWAHDFYDELANEARIIGNRVNPPQTTTVAKTERIKAHLAHKYQNVLDKNL